MARLVNFSSGEKLSLFSEENPATYHALVTVYAMHQLARKQ
jgi:hypothetical protein